METIYATGSDRIELPAWVTNFESFRRWMHSAAFPDEGRIVFINGKVWMDPLMEEFSSHNAVRAELGRVLGNLMKETKFGRFVPDGMRYSHFETELATEPDGMIVSHDAFISDRVRLAGGETGMQTEMVGSPEILIEIVSDSSEVKDTEWLMSAYFDAGVEELWVIDAREEDDIRFDIFKRGRKQFVATKKAAGWVKSAVLGKSFRLTQEEGTDGNPDYTLSYR